jgi:hypothetical protein
MVGYIGSYMTAECISHCKDDVVEFVIVPKIMHHDTEKVKDVVIGLLSIEGNSQF